MAVCLFACVALLLVGDSSALPPDFFRVGWESPFRQKTSGSFHLTSLSITSIHAILGLYTADGYNRHLPPVSHLSSFLFLFFFVLIVFVCLSLHVIPFVLIAIFIVALPLFYSSTISSSFLLSFSSFPVTSFASPSSPYALTLSSLRSSSHMAHNTFSHGT